MRKLHATTDLVGRGPGMGLNKRHTTFYLLRWNDDCPYCIDKNAKISPGHGLFEANYGREMAVSWQPKGAQMAV